MDVSWPKAAMNFGGEVRMRKRELQILGGAILGFGVILGVTFASPATEVSELKVTIREWDVPTKGAHRMILRSARTARCGSRNR